MNLVTQIIVLLYSDFDDEVVSLKQFTTEDIVASVVRCLKTINSDVELPNTLPGAMSAKFRIGTSLASHIQVGTSKIFEPHWDKTY